jgi:hypothetical protein
LVKPDQVQQFTPETINQLTNAQLANLFKNIENKTTLKEKIQSFVPEELVNLKKYFDYVTSDQLKKLLGKPNLVKELTKEQIQKINPEFLARALEGTFTSIANTTILRHLNPFYKETDKIETLPDSFVNALSAKQAQAIIAMHDGIFTFSHFQDYFTKDQQEQLRQKANSFKTIDSLNKFNSLNENEKKDFVTWLANKIDLKKPLNKDFNVSALSGNTEEYNNLLSLIKKRILSLKPNEISSISPAYLNMLTDWNEVKDLRPEQIDALTTQQTKALRIQFVEQLNAGQIAALINNHKRVAALSETKTNPNLPTAKATSLLVAALNPEALAQALQKAIRAVPTLPDSFVDALTSEQAAAIINNPSLLNYFEEKQREVLKKQAAPSKLSDFSTALNNPENDFDDSKNLLGIKTNPFYDLDI